MLRISRSDWKTKPASFKQLELITSTATRLDKNKQSILEHATRYYSIDGKVYFSFDQFTQGTASAIIDWLIGLSKEI